MCQTQNPRKHDCPSRSAQVQASVYAQTDADGQAEKSRAHPEEAACHSPLLTLTTMTARMRDTSLIKIVNTGFAPVTINAVDSFAQVVFLPYGSTLSAPPEIETVA